MSEVTTQPTVTQPRPLLQPQPWPLPSPMRHMLNKLQSIEQKKERKFGNLEALLMLLIEVEPVIVTEREKANETVSS